nr:hypothetical protein BaRGS_022998 [Batillaria attramentaria]
MRGTGSEWNAALFGDAVCRAYLTLLENVQAEAAKDKDYQRYYGLWPDSGQESLDQHFYRRLVSDNNKVFPVPVRNKWVAFQDAWFLDADFRESECGTGKLEYPRRLLHPSKQASKLYRASEGRFPQGAESQKNADQVNFCHKRTLNACRGLE